MLPQKEFANGSLKTNAYSSSITSSRSARSIENRTMFTPRLFHFSDDDSIEVFEPRGVRVASARGAGREWLNGPLVWAIDEWHQPMYLFPRECPRILLWRKGDSTPHDVQKYLGTSAARIVAVIERGWLDLLRSETLCRYELPAAPFVSLNDAGMWVSRSAVRPLAKRAIGDLPATLASSGVELRVQDSLVPLHDAWNSSLHVSGIRLRNATGWENVS